VASDFSPPDQLTHAVVIGAGMGGLVVAHALSRHVDRVTVVERDALPTEPAPRPGVPHGRHAHVLQPGGLASLERLLPGFGDALTARGAVPVALPRDLLWLSTAGWMQPHPTGDMALLAASRDLIESVTREMVLARAPIALRTGVEVRALAVRDGRVTGVDLLPRGAAPSEPTERLVADLVVDASGRRSKAPEWLEAAGFERPREESIDADLAYATRLYRRGPDDLDGWKAMFLQPKAPDRTRMAVLFPQEDDRWILTIAGTNGDIPPTDEAGFHAFARGMRSPVLGDVLDRLEPLSPIIGFRRTENRRRHFEELRDAPDGFVAVADSACAFNPVYGQGMAVAAMTAEALDEVLTDHVALTGGLAGAAARVQKVVARISEGAWMVATGEDLRFPDTVGGHPSLADRVVRRYFDRLVRAATSDPVANLAFGKVIGMTEPPTSLMRPALAWRVLTRRVPDPTATPPLPLRTPAPALVG
jgi:2-polyprenyl-6-methoxyphenol hydroxylase-like FAD-dependent oxidoreductase